MNIMLGNLSITQIEERLGIDFPEEIRDFMKATHQPKASNVKSGQWHCFDIPFALLCGDVETAKKIYESVKERSEECKCTLEFVIEN